MSSSASKSTCELHGVELYAAQVRVVYGLPTPDDFAYLQASRESFPYGKLFVLGGCITSDVKQRDSLICRECRAAEEEWRSVHEK